jgi:HD-like signal output (HDOD) protein
VTITTGAYAELSSNGQALATYLEQLVDGRKIEVPMLPEVASRVLALSNDPDSDAAQLANLIQGDQALAGHVMRIANSAAYTPNASMVSLQQAIARLGMGVITEISLVASLNSKMFDAPDYKGRIAEIWSHALCTALWGKEVARTSKRNVEASFLCGLLHSIGRPVVLQSISDYQREHQISVSNDEALVLEQLFHVGFGEVVVEKWGMPIIVQESVQFYQNYAESKRSVEQAMVINAAAKLASEMLVPAESDFDEVLSGIVFADLNLYEDDIETLKLKEETVISGLEAMRV